jgi:adenosylmethionine-8-amino-7-oxononanoate aminotransferase
MRRERLARHVAAQEDAFRTTLSPLLDLEIGGKLRGPGYFWALELVRDNDMRSSFSRASSATWLLRAFLSKCIPDRFRRGVRRPDR